MAVNPTVALRYCNSKNIKELFFPPIAIIAAISNPCTYTQTEIQTASIKRQRDS